MNNDEQFEDRLRRQLLRQVPAAWREEILSAAEATRRESTPQNTSEDQAALLAGWRLLFGRLPIAWAALAALWVALIGVNLAMPSPFVSVMAQTLPAPGVEALAALDLPGADFQPSGPRLSPTPRALPASDAPVVPRRPRSELRRDLEIGSVSANMFEDFIT